MRFVHKDIPAVLRYLEAEHCRILRLEWDREPLVGGFSFLPTTRKRRAALPAVASTISEVEFFGGKGRGPEHAIIVLQHYFHMNSSAVGRPLALVEAVEHVEGSGEPGEFLLAGHPEGGLISVSRERLPLQQGLQPITWWGP
jgi:hypothetical protein